MSKLVEGKIPARTVCPWRGQCEIAQGGACHHKGEQHEGPFSCGAARGFDMLELHKETENVVAAAPRMAVTLDPFIMQTALQRYLDSLEFPKDMMLRVRVQEHLQAFKDPHTPQIMKGGGVWLGRVREWIQGNAINGSDVLWGSHTPLRFTGGVTAYMLEELALSIARVTINEFKGWNTAFEMQQRQRQRQQQEDTDDHSED